MRIAENPYDLFREWMADAQANEPALPDALSLATVNADGAPSVRMVLLKGVDDAGFVFYTNLGSRKGQHLAGNPKAAMCFHWKSLRKQVRVEGEVAPLPGDEADAYFASRDRGSQIGAWASKQSRPLEGRFELEARIAKFAARFHVGKVPRPEFWSGFRLAPSLIEFWDDGSFRLHDRLEYLRDGAGWSTRWLYP